MGTQQRLHRPARLGGGLYPRRRLDRLRRHLRPALRRRPSAAVRDAALPLGRADHRRRRAGARSTFDFEMKVDAPARGAARHPALLRGSLGEARRAGRPGRSRSRRSGRAPDHGRRADLRLDRRFRRAGMEHRGGRPDQAGARRDADPPPAATASRRAASCITARANGIPARACRAGPFRSTGARTASRSGAIAALIAGTPAQARRATDEDARAPDERIGRPARHRRRLCHSRL